MHLGEIVKKYRIDNSLSMGQFAIKSGLSKSYISLLEQNYNPSTNKEITPSVDIIKKVADAMKIDFNELFNMLSDNDEIVLEKTKGIKIPVLGKVPCGVPIEAIEEILDYEEITEQMSRTGTYFGLMAKGDSMTPQIQDGDILIVKQTSACDSGNIAIVKVNGDDATCKKVDIGERGITLIPYNASYETKFYLPNEIKDLPITICGVVVEIRRKLI